MERQEERVLVLGADSNDTSSIREILQHASLPADTCNSIEDLASRLKEGAGTAVLEEKALRAGGAEILFAELQKQPPGSDLQFVLLTAPGGSLGPAGDHLMEVFGESANITILEHPVRAGTLASVVRTALRARRRQEDLRQTQKLESIGVLAGGVAHDFNNLLVGILGNASLAREMLPADDPARPLLDDVVVAGQRAAALTRQLLAYSGKGRFLIQSVDLSSLAREISSLIQPSIPKLVRLRMDLGRALPAIEGDSSQLQQLIMNLVINGAESIGERTGTVTIATHICDVREETLPRVIPPTEIRPGRYVCLEVHDDGAGMDAQTMSRIFDPFFTTKFTGRGLGLAAALGIVRGHRGGIEVESAPGQGATFRVYFPAAGALEEQRNGSAHDDLSGQGLILFVDDEEVVRGVARTSLSRFGYNVLLAENGQDAIDILRRRPGIALVILDMTMPVMSGEETLRELQTIRPNLKVVLSSGYNEAETVARLGGRALSGFLQKPYTATELAQKVKAALATSATMQG